MKILIVEDDNEISEFLRSALKSECIEADVVVNGNNAPKMIRDNEYDLIVLDLMLPGLNGDKLCQMIREEGNNVPILILSVESDVGDKVSLLNLGADDFLAKPFSLEEFMARAHALLRRPKAMRDDVIKLGDLSIDSKRHLVTVKDEIISLTNKEFSLLELLAKNPGVVLSRSKIIEHVWDMNADLFSNSIEVHIFNLRKKIRDKMHQDVIQTIANRGYKLELMSN
ncbi:MAG: response regulator transcription factor [Patescibacteria group bacterium]